MDSKVPQKPLRKFLGKTENFKDNRERHFYQRMLKAYLRGDSFFYFGFIGFPRKPEKHEVMELNGKE